MAYKIPRNNNPNKCPQCGAIKIPRNKLCDHCSSMMKPEPASEKPKKPRLDKSGIILIVSFLFLSFFFSGGLNFPGFNSGNPSRCRANMKMLETAFQMYQMEHGFRDELVPSGPLSEPVTRFTGVLKQQGYLTSSPVCSQSRSASSYILHREKESNMLYIHCKIHGKLR